MARGHVLPIQIAGRIVEHLQVQHALRIDVHAGQLLGRPIEGRPASAKAKAASASATEGRNAVAWFAFAPVPRAVARELSRNASSHQDSRAVLWAEPEKVGAYLRVREETCLGHASRHRAFIRYLTGRSSQGKGNSPAGCASRRGASA